MKVSLYEVVIDFSASKNDCGGLLRGGNCLMIPLVIPDKFEFREDGNGGPKIDPEGGSLTELLNFGASYLLLRLRNELPKASSSSSLMLKGFIT